MGLNRNKIINNTKEDIISKYDNDEILDVVLDFNFRKKEKIFNLKEMRDILKNEFKNIIINDDYIIIKMRKNDLIKNLKFIREYFNKFEIENDNSEYFIEMI